MITIKIKTDNAAFNDGNKNRELARILREIAFWFDDDVKLPLRVADNNGNNVCKVTED